MEALRAHAVLLVDPVKAAVVPEGAEEALYRIPKHHNHRHRWLRRSKDRRKNGGLCLAAPETGVELISKLGL